MNNSANSISSPSYLSVPGVPLKNLSIGKLTENEVLGLEPDPKIAVPRMELDPVPPRDSGTADLYVSATLETDEIEFIPELARPDDPDGRTGYAQEFIERRGNQTVKFRRLDPVWYAWLRDRMRRAQAAGLPPAVWADLRTRFNGIREWALARWGQEVLNQATVPKGYQAP